MSLTLCGGCLEAGISREDPVTRRLALVLEYDGTAYAGSQRQAGAPTVQRSVEEALLKLTGDTVTVSMAGRTDTGAHARGQVVSFVTTSSLPNKAFIHGLNYHLPHDIAVKSAEYTNDDFDPRRHAINRNYEYMILNRSTRSPLWLNRAYHVPTILDLDLMNQAAALLIGKHEFASFVGAIETGKSTVRQVYQARFHRQSELIIFNMSANAFLPHQVRITVGTLLRVGQRKITVSDFKDILDACQHGLAGPSVPAYGLYLNQVVYSNNEGNDENV